MTKIKKSGILKNLFTSKNRVKILGFLFFEKERSYIREISKRTNIPVSIVKNEIDNLVSIGLLIKESDYILVNNECNFIDELKNIFIKTDYIFIPFREALLKINVDFIFIFGSFANQNYNTESDIDLFIIGDISLDNVYKFLKPLEEKTKRNINPVLWTKKEILKEKKKSFIQDIIMKNIIMIKGDENEFRKIIAG